MFLDAELRRAILAVGKRVSRKKCPSAGPPRLWCLAELSCERRSGWELWSGWERSSANWLLQRVGGSGEPFS